MDNETENLLPKACTDCCPGPWCRSCKHGEYRHFIELSRRYENEGRRDDTGRMDK